MIRLLAYLSKVGLGVAGALLLAACSTTLVEDPEQQVAAGTTRCTGSEGVDDSSIAVLPVPVAAFFVPHADVNEVRGEEYLNRCGPPSKLVNREVKVDRTACIPASLTRIITLGVWQWCPARVSWEADVVK